MINYLIVTGIVVCLLIIIKLSVSDSGKVKKPGSVMDELSHNPIFRERKGFYDAMHALH